MELTKKKIELLITALEHYADCDIDVKERSEVNELISELYQED